MNGEIQITDLVISKLLRQNIEKYRSLFPHVAAAIRLNISGVIADGGDNIQYVYTDSNHADPLQRITPAKLDSAEAVLSVFGFNRSLYGFDKKRPTTGGMRFTSNARKTSNLQNQNYEND